MMIWSLSLWGRGHCCTLTQKDEEKSTFLKSLRNLNNFGRFEPFFTICLPLMKILCIPLKVSVAVARNQSVPEVFQHHNRASWMIASFPFRTVIECKINKIPMTLKKIIINAQIKKKKKLDYSVLQTHTYILRKKKKKLYGNTLPLNSTLQRQPWVSFH